MIGVLGGCFFMLIIAKKLEPYLKLIFSFYYVWSQSTNILIAFSGLDMYSYINILDLPLYLDSIHVV